MSPGGVGPLFARIERLPPIDRRIVRFVMVASALALVGLTVTGVAVFFEHKADVSWTRVAELELGFPGEPESTVLEDIHSTIGTFGGIIALIGGGVIAVRVLHRVAGVLATGLAMVVVGAITGSIIRYNVVERSDGFDESAQGYQQFFGGDVVRVITDRSEFGSRTVAVLVLVHLATVPIIIVSAWVTLRRSDRARAAAEAWALERRRSRAGT